MEILKKKKEKEQETANPMEESEYCYYQSFGKALKGFAKALELRQGRLSSVATADILDYADIDKEEFEFLFGDPIGLLEDIHGEILDIFLQAQQIMAGASTNLLLTSIFKRLRKNTPMLVVLRILNDHNIWRDALKNLAKEIIPSWHDYNSGQWEYIFCNFCCQFAIILEVWEATGFAEDQIDNCVRRLKAWIEADEMVARVTDDSFSSNSTDPV